MVAVQIRNVPESVRVALADQAARRGQSLQAYLLELVSAQAARAANPVILARFAGRSDGATTEQGEIPELITATRTEATATIGQRRR